MERTKRDLVIPAGIFAASEEDAAAAQRRKIAELLRRREEVAVEPSGEVKPADPKDTTALVVPPAELA